MSASILFSAAATCSQSSGRQWPPVATSICFFIGSHLQPLEWPPVAARILFSSATTCSHLQPIEWPQVAARASGRKWPQVAARASGRMWPQVAAFAKIKFVPFCTLSVNVVYQYIIAFLILSWTSDCDARWDTASKLRPEL